MDIVDDLRNFLESATAKLSDEAFVSHDNTIYPRRKIESEFLSRLEHALDDTEKAHRIYQSFKNHFGSLLNDSEKKTLEDWIITNVRFMGAFPFYSHWQGQLEQPIKTILTSYLSNAAAFFEEIKTSEKPCRFPVVKDPSKPKNIVILTTSSGGGHKSVTAALEQILKKFPEKYHVTVISVSEVFKPSDPLYRLSGIISGEEVYDKVFQQRREVALAQKLWELNPKLQTFVENNSMKVLKDKIRPLNPDLIISSCHFLDRDLDVASSLGVPLRFAHCDYELNWAMVPLVSKINPATVKLWLPAKDPEILHPVSSKLKSELIQQLSLTHSEGDIDRLIQIKAQTVFDYAGFPVRSSFKRVTDPQTLEELRNRYHVAKDSQVVVLQMGNQGVGILANMVKTLNENRSVTYDRPVHLAVFCGTNEEMRGQLLAYLNTLEKHPQIHFDILPLVNQETAAEYLAIADAEVMKPGGATTGEALFMGVNTLIFVDPEHPWEGCNKDQMVRHNIGTVIKSLDTIPSQLKEVLCKPKNREYKPINAEETVPALVDEAIHTFEKFQLKKDNR